MMQGMGGAGGMGGMGGGGEMVCLHFFSRITAAC